MVDGIHTLVEGNRRFKDSYRLHFVPVLHEVMVHSALLPKCPHDSARSLERRRKTSMTNENQMKMTGHGLPFVFCP